MSPYTTFLFPGDPIPDPPESKMFAAIVSGICTLAILAFILFLSIEFFMDMAGKPLRWEDKTVLEVPDQEEWGLRETVATQQQRVRNILRQMVVLYPANQMRVMGPDVHVLCRWDSRLGEQIEESPITLDLFVDGVVVPWEMRFGRNTWLARMKLDPGRHRIHTAVFDTDIYVENASTTNTEDVPRHWGLLKTHPSIAESDRCGDCHDYANAPSDLRGKGRDRSLAFWRNPQTCMTCHSMEEFAATHQHQWETLRDCSRCHILHGTSSPQKALLRSSPQKLCVECHEAR